MTLPGRKPAPENKSPRVKLLLLGSPGVGKTYFALQWPNSVYIDAENALTAEYEQKLAANGSVVIDSQSGGVRIENITSHIRSYSTQEHDFKTIIVDSYSHPYEMQCAESEVKEGSDYGRHRKVANELSRQLWRAIYACDMNIVLIAHEKPEFTGAGESRVQTGHTFVGYDKLLYDFDLSIRAVSGGSGNPAVGIVQKARTAGFDVGDYVPLTFSDFAKKVNNPEFYRLAQPKELITEEQYSALIRLASEEDLQRYCSAKGIFDLKDLPSDRATALINHLESRTK